MKHPARLYPTELQHVPMEIAAIVVQMVLRIMANNAVKM